MSRLGVEVIYNDGDDKYDSVVVMEDDDVLSVVEDHI